MGKHGTLDVPLIGVAGRSWTVAQLKCIAPAALGARTVVANGRAYATHSPGRDCMCGSATRSARSSLPFPGRSSSVYARCIPGRRGPEPVYSDFLFVVPEQYADGQLDRIEGLRPNAFGRIRCQDLEIAFGGPSIDR